MHPDAPRAAAVRTQTPFDQSGHGPNGYSDPNTPEHAAQTDADSPWAHGKLSRRTSQASLDSARVSLDSVPSSSVSLGVDARSTASRGPLRTVSSLSTQKARRIGLTARDAVLFTASQVFATCLRCGKFNSFYASSRAPPW